MNHSLIRARVHGPGLPPDHLSIEALTTPLGRRNVETGQFWVYSRTKARHRGAAAVSEIAGCRARGSEWSLLPIHTPTARAGRPAVVGGARKPYVARSRASFAVPVFTAAGRCVPFFVLRNSSFADQIGFWERIVLPARMSVTRYAAPAEIARVAAGLGAFQTTRPSGPRISRTIRGGTRTPPLAMVP